MWILVLYVLPLVLGLIAVLWQYSTQEVVTLEEILMRLCVFVPLFNWAIPVIFVSEYVKENANKVVWKKDVSKEGDK